MHDISVINKQNFPLDISSIERTISKAVKYKTVKVAIIFVDDEEMTKLHIKFMHEERTTDVLSFPIETLAPDGLLWLGDIVISYPQAKKQAEENNITVNEEINKLVEHGTLHLLGIHHEEIW